MTATPGSASSAGSRRHLDGIAEIRTFFRTNQQPIYFVGPTAFNLLGIDRWVRNFQYIAYYDSWDGQHPRVFTPENRPYVEFESSEQINNYLLRDPEVQEYLRRRDADFLAVATPGAGTLDLAKTDTEDIELITETAFRLCTCDPKILTGRIAHTQPFLAEVGWPKTGPLTG